MRKSLLAVAALMGAAILPAEAAVIKVDENTFANTGLKLQIWAQRLGKTTTDGEDYTDFSINNARIYFSGQVNFVQFGANLDFALYQGSSGRTNHGGTKQSRVNDAFINLKLMDEFQVMAGLYRLPFSRAALTDSYTYVIPTGYGYSTRGNLFTPFTIGSVSEVKNGYRDAGLTFWGNIMDGLIKYQIGVFDGRWDHVDPYDLGVKDNLAFAGRIQFTPTMLGFKGEKGFTLADTYLGKQNVLSIGLGYNTQKWDDGTGNSATAKAWTVDAMWEQKFGDIVPNLQLGYQYRKDMPAATKDRAYYVQGQLLFDQVVGLGKPALAIRYEKLDDRTASDLDTDRVGVFLNYYIKGQDAKIQFGADVVSLKNRDPDEKNYTDWTLALQIQF